MFERPTILSRHVDEVSILNQNKSRRLDIAQPDERSPARDGGAFCLVKYQSALSCAHRLQKCAHISRLNRVGWIFYCLPNPSRKRRGVFLCVGGSGRAGKLQLNCPDI